MKRSANVRVTYKMRNSQNRDTPTESFGEEIYRPQSLNHLEMIEEIKNLSTQVKGLMTDMGQLLKSKHMVHGRKVKVEPREKQIEYQLYKLPKDAGEDQRKERLEVWITGLCREVFSTAFHYFQTGQTTYQQAKIFCSENIIRNIVRLNSSIELTRGDVENINKHIQEGVTEYLLSKYPMTEKQIINKRLEGIVREIDNIEALQNDAFFYSKDCYGFQYRESGIYNDLIMKLINDMMKKMDEKQPDGKETFFGEFYTFMQKFFEKIEERKQVPGEQKIQDVSLRKINDDKYRQRVKSYTSYVIGRKISQNVSLYSQAQINSHHMVIKDPAILRILTKWSQELWKKFNKKNYFLDRSQNVQIQKGGGLNTYFAWMKKIINEMIEEEKIEIEKFVEELFQNNYDQQAAHLFRSVLSTGFTYVEKIEKASGIFAVSIVNNLHSYIILYLNRLIHGLLRVSKKFYDRELINKARWTSPPNLISFKIGDLMRCKIASQEKEIERLYEELNEISAKHEDTLKIVRIKNRLKEGTNDILINLRFKNTFVCELQLAINSNHSNFIKCSNKYNHFIYELKRSIFGPLCELCSIWRSLDGRCKVYEKIALKNKVDLKIKQPNNTRKSQAIESQSKLYECQKSQSKIHRMQRFNRPFICSKCNKHYSHNNYIWSHRSCAQCSTVFECSKCRISSEDETSLKDKLFENYEDLKKICTRLEKDEDIPKYGACFLIESKKRKLRLFVKLCIKGRISLFTNQKGQKDKKTKIDELAQLNTPGDIQNFKNSYIIFKLPIQQGDKLVHLTEKDTTIKYLLPKQIKMIYKKQKEMISLNKEAIEDADCREILDGDLSGRLNINVLELIQSGITDVGHVCEKFPNLSRLVLSRNKIKDISPVCKLKDLQTLNVRNNAIEKLPLELFQMKKLKVLNIRFNPLLKSIPQQVGQLVTLTQLELNELQLTQLPDSFSKLVNISYLNLSKNNFKVVPPQIKTLIQIQFLGLKENNISQIPQWLENFKKMKAFTIQSNEIINGEKIICLKVEAIHLEKQKPKTQQFSLGKSKINPSILQLFVNENKISKIDDDFFVEATTLNTLDMSKNELRQLPESLGKCAELKRLIVSSNKLSALPDSFSQLSELQMLDLSDNQFAIFPQQLTSCVDLVDLTLTGNTLSSIPDNFFKNAVKLQRINLSKTGINSMSSQMSKCRYLKVLNLAETAIKLEDMGQLKQLIHLESLNLSQMKLTKLPKELGELYNLEKLNASSNNLIEIDEHIFRNLKRLRHLILQNCGLEKAPDSLANCQRLKEIRLNRNLLTQVPEAIFKLSQLNQLQLGDNCIKNIQTKESLPKSLKVLNLNHNQLVSISESFFKESENLVSIEIQYSKLWMVPKSLQNCIKVSEANLKNNPTGFDKASSEEMLKLNSIHVTVPFPKIIEQEQLCAKRP